MRNLEPSAAGSSVPSPCIKQCRLDEKRECIACGRTLDEIGAWRTMTDSAKLLVWERIKSRTLEPSPSN